MNKTTELGKNDKVTKNLPDPYKDHLLTSVKCHHEVHLSFRAELSCFVLMTRIQGQKYFCLVVFFVSEKVTSIFNCVLYTNVS